MVISIDVGPWLAFAIVAAITLIILERKGK